MIRTITLVWRCHAPYAKRHLVSSNQRLHRFYYRTQVRAAAAASNHVEVAVIGGGIGGLTFARVLQKHGQDAVIYEKDPSPSSRTQGGMLDLHIESGQWALKQAGLFAEFEKLICEGGQDMRIVDQNGKVHWDEIGPPGSAGRPEVDRPALRSLLLDSLQPGTIQWGCQLVAVESNGAEGHTLRFADGTAITADLVIGADGAGSRVRSRLTNAQPQYSGITWFSIQISDAAQNHPDVASSIGHGTWCALGENKGILAHRNGDGAIRAYAVCRVAEGSLTEEAKAWQSPSTSHHAVASMFKGWAPEILNVILCCDEDMTLTPRPVTALPVGLRWASQPDVTLLGDAAHLMSPFAGEGANLAMQDGAQLALELVKGQTHAQAIAAYEADMFSRAEPAAQESAANLDLCISENGAEKMAQIVSGHEAAPGQH